MKKPSRREAARDVAVVLGEAAHVGDQHQAGQPAAPSGQRRVGAQRVAVALVGDVFAGHSVTRLLRRAARAPARRTSGAVGQSTAVPVAERVEQQRVQPGAAARPTTSTA